MTSQMDRHPALGGTSRLQASLRSEPPKEGAGVWKNLGRLMSLDPQALDKVEVNRWR